MRLRSGSESQNQFRTEVRTRSEAPRTRTLAPLWRRKPVLKFLDFWNAILVTWLSNTSPRSCSTRINAEVDLHSWGRAENFPSLQIRKPIVSLSQLSVANLLLKMSRGRDIQDGTEVKNPVVKFWDAILGAYL